MQRLLIVSNRLPLTIQERKGDLHIEHSVGGLATGLSSWYKSSNQHLDRMGGDRPETNKKGKRHHGEIAI